MREPGGHKSWIWVLISVGFISGCGGGSDTVSLQSIALAPITPTAAAGNPIQIAATGIYSDGTHQNLTSQVHWVSSNSAVATINAMGVANALTPGSTTITASFIGISGNTVLTVGPPVPVSVAVTPVNPTVQTLLSLRTPFIATATFSDKTTIDSTVAAVWSTSNSAVGTISVSNESQCNGLEICPLGVVTSVGVGSTLITAVVTWNSVTVSGSTTLTVAADQPQWTWTSGSKTAGAAGIYGTQGTPASGNTPGARSGALSFTDASTAALYLLGGYGVDSAGTQGYLNDLWAYNPATALWTWVSGANTVGALDGTSSPGARSGGLSWMVGQKGALAGGIFWIFGGEGLDSVGTQGYLGDLWFFSPAKGWSFVGGSETANFVGDCEIAAQSPGARKGSVSWPVGNTGDNFLYLFGGYGYTCSGTPGLLNDLWMYEPTGEPARWIQIGGSTSPGAPGVYGSKGVAVAGNTPGARMGSTSFADGAGNLWLFGGTGLDATGAQGTLNDLWKFNGSSWTWVSGSNSVDAAGVYGTRGTAAAANMPGARNGGGSWTDAAGKFWLFGGTGLDSTGVQGTLNDLWMYDPATGLWTWVRGSNVTNSSGSYGTENAPVAGNTPGSRLGPVSWIDGPGHLWLFGGDGQDAIGTQGYLNDMWIF